jgi:predicted P-loop ATPase
MDEYARFMIKKYGTGVLEDLAEKKNTIVKGMDYERLIEDYRRELCLVGTT